MEYTIQQIATLIDAQIINNQYHTVKNLIIDTRLINNTEKALFFALSGVQKNGHAYIEEAYKKGIKSFIVNTIDNYQRYPDACFLIVKDTLHALQTIAKFHRLQHHLPLIGITGSNGKTILKEWLFQMLNTDYQIIRNPKSYNSQIGVPLSVWEINSTHNLGIFEAGISKPAEMAVLQNILQPNYGIFTHLGYAHLENFESQRQIFEEKLKLFSTCKWTVLAINEAWQLAVLHKQRTAITWITWSMQDKNIATDFSISVKKDFYLHKTTIYLTEKESYTIPFVNDALIENSITLILVLLQFRLSKKDISKRLNHLERIKMRLELLEGMYHAVIISDTYNSDFDSVKMALNMLAHQSYPSKSLVITDFDSFSEEILDAIRQLNLEYLIWIGDQQKELPKNIAKSIRYYKNTTDFIADFSFKKFYQHAVLFKGARRFKLETAVKKFMNKTHETVFEISLENLVHNLNYFKSKLYPQTKIMVMVKASSYGSGVYEVASLLKFHKVDYLGVAYPDEGFQLRDLKIDMPIMVMNASKSSYESLINYELEPEIYSINTLNAFIALAHKQNLNQYPIHIKLDTGMHRLGFEEEDCPILINILIANQKYIKVKSIFSHLASSDVPEQKDFVLLQIKKFEYIYKKISQAINYQPIKHILNSSGISHFTPYQFDMVRLGIGLYGYNFDPNVQKHLLPIGVLKSIISQIKFIPPGESVGYSRRYKAEKMIKIATIPIGYADGISRLQGNGVGYVMINNQKAIIIGNICMDMLMVDITSLNCEEGDEVILLGDCPRLEEVATWQQTIPYEVLTSIAERVKRIYYR